MISTAISISDLLTMLMVILTFFYVRYQKKLTLIAERELKIKIKDISDLINKIEQERLDRKAQNQDRLNAEERIWLYANEINTTTQNISFDLELKNISHLETLHVSIVTISKLLDLLITHINEVMVKLNPDFKFSIFQTSSVLQGIINHNFSHFKSIHIEDKFLRGIRDAKDAFDGKYQLYLSSTDSLKSNSKNMEIINSEYKRDIAMVVNEFNSSITQHKTEIDKTKTEFSNSIKMMSGEERESTL